VTGALEQRREVVEELGLGVALGWDGGGEGEE
jgi:hypothetical protein